MQTIEEWVGLTWDSNREKLVQSHLSQDNPSANSFLE